MTDYNIFSRVSSNGTVSSRLDARGKRCLLRGLEVCQSLETDGLPVSPAIAANAEAAGNALRELVNDLVSTETADDSEDTSDTEVDSATANAK